MKQITAGEPPDAVEAGGDWRRRGECRDRDPELFFAGKSNPSRVAEARALCDTVCTVKPQCLAWALGQPGLEGIWAATDEDQRRLLRRQLADMRVLAGCRNRELVGLADAARVVWLTTDVEHGGFTYRDGSREDRDAARRLLANGSAQWSDQVEQVRARRRVTDGRRLLPTETGLAALTEWVDPIDAARRVGVAS